MDRDRGQMASDDLNPVLQPGESLGNFRVTECLSAGLIANYFQAKHVTDLHEVTVCVFHQRVGRDPDFIERLKLLQKKIALLDHEGVPQINEYAEINGKICLFMEPFSGRSLAQYFVDQAGHEEGIGVEETIRILAQLLGLLGYIHSKGLDHRDMDSDLIFIREDGSLSLLGIGLKAALGVPLFEEVVSASVSPLNPQQSVERLSSFDVMSPEYKSGIEEDHRVDLYCVGVLGYWLLTGQKADQARYRAPSEYIGAKAAYWDPFFEKMLRRDRDQRIQSCRSALLALRNTDAAPAAGKKALIERQIARIPVPKGVRARGKLATRTYRLSMIGLIGIPLVAIAANFMLSVFIEEEAPRTEVVQRVVGEETPQLELRVTPAAAKVEFIGSDKSFVLRSGQIALSLAPGEYELRVSAPRHVGQKKRVVISEDSELTRKMTFNLEEDRLRLSLRSEPLAKIFLVNSKSGKIELGEAGADGRFEIDRESPQGDFRIEARKQGYEPASLSSDAIAEEATSGEENAGDLPALNLPLVALPAEIRFTTQPPGARILLDREVIGLSPLTMVELEPRDEFLVTAEMEGFRPREKRIEIKPGSQQVIDFGVLVPRSGEIQAELQFEGVDQASVGELRENTVIRIGEVDYPADSEAIQSVPAGRHTVRAEHPLYISEVKEIELGDGEEKSIRFQLKARPGSVHLDYPEGFSPRVSVGGRELKIQDGQIRLPANETLKLEVRIRDHLTLVRQLRLEPTESIDWRIDPVRITPPEKGRDWTVPYTGIRMVWVPAGKFQMGSPLPEQGRVPNEGPLTSVTFTQGFWSGALEVTQAQYKYVMGENPSSYTGAKHPVDSLSWDQARAFCERLTALERKARRLPDGYVYRLPTEAEWAYAARAGTETPFHFGETADASKGNFIGVYPRDFEGGERQSGHYGTKPVGQYAPNAFGLYDVHGNVREWTQDAYTARLPGGRLTDPEPQVGRGQLRGSRRGLGRSCSPGPQRCPR